MGISIDSKLIYGMHYKDLVDGLNEEQIEELQEALDDGEVDYASPYYDSERDRWIVGYELSRGVVNMETFNESVENAKFDFFKKFGTYGEVCVVNHVY